ncbi:MAG TPA: hypothetical protein PLO51_02690 [Candidatus Micrarchaeota archaeon]|nr:hypothetical protein [Candidatus Micrarchaeota archaeon]
MAVTQARADNSNVSANQVFIFTIQRTNKAATNIFEALRNTQNTKAKALLFRSLELTSKEADSNLFGTPMYDDIEKQVPKGRRYSQNAKE